MQTNSDAPSVGNFRVVRSYRRLPPNPGGMESHISHLTTAQRRSGVQVTSVFNSGTPEGANLRVLAGLDLGKIRPDTLRNAMFYGAAAMSVSELRSDIPAVLHVHGSLSDFAFARPFGAMMGAQALAASIHGVIPSTRAALFRLVLRSYDPILTTGMAEKVLLENAIQRPVHHMPSAPDSIFLESKLPEAPFLWDVVSVGNLFPIKNPDLILDCAALRPELRFSIFGDGPLRTALEVRIRDERLHNVSMMGSRPKWEIAAALARSRMFLSTSKGEGTPTAVLEAMAVGLPVVLTPSNQYDWLVRGGVNGFVTESFNVDELVARIDGILSDSHTMVTMGAENRKRALNHTWESNAKFVNSLFLRSLGPL